jgi:hypothetical protein
MDEPDDEKEVIHIGNPENKPKRALSFRISRGGKTGRQKKDHARTIKMIADPKNIADNPPKQKLSRGQQKRLDYHKRLARQAAAKEKAANTGAHDEK